MDRGKRRFTVPWRRLWAKTSVSSGRGQRGELPKKEQEKSPRELLRSLGGTCAAREEVLRESDVLRDAYEEANKKKKAEAVKKRGGACLTRRCAQGGLDAQKEGVTVKERGKGGTLERKLRA